MAVFFPSMLVGVAQKAGIKVPPDPEGKYNPDEYPHWTVLCHWQLGRSLPRWEAPLHNAQVIAAIPDDRIKLVQWHELENMGAL